MEMHLQPLARSCFVSGEPFVDGARVASYLVRATTLEIVRYDLLESRAAGFSPDIAAFVRRRWSACLRLLGWAPPRRRAARRR